MYSTVQLATTIDASILLYIHYVMAVGWVFTDIDVAEYTISFYSMFTVSDRTIRYVANTSELNRHVDNQSGCFCLFLFLEQLNSNLTKGQNSSGNKRDDPPLRDPLFPGYALFFQRRWTNIL
jgi:hypothetical protein